MTFNNVNFATITLSQKESLARQEVVQFIGELKRTLESRHVDRIIRADSGEVIERKELMRVLGILNGFDTTLTYWHQEEEE